MEEITFQQQCARATRNIKSAVAKELNDLKEQSGMYPDSVTVEVMQRHLFGTPSEFMVSNVNLTFRA